jgi:hypothetical protein
MSATVTFRLDPETARILKDLTRRRKTSKSRAVKEALHAHWKSVVKVSAPSAWEVYSQLNIPAPANPRRDRARHVSRLLKEKLLAKRREGTL